MQLPCTCWPCMHGSTQHCRGQDILVWECVLPTLLWVFDAAEVVLLPQDCTAESVTYLLLTPGIAMMRVCMLLHHPNAACCATA